MGVEGCSIWKRAGRGRKLAWNRTGVEENRGKERRGVEESGR